MKNFSVKKAHKTQLCLSKKIILSDRLPPKIRTIAGVDVSYIDNTGVGAITVLDYESLELLEAKVATCLYILLTLISSFWACFDASCSVVFVIVVVPS